MHRAQTLDLKHSHLQELEEFYYSADAIMSAPVEESLNILIKRMGCESVLQSWDKEHSIFLKRLSLV